MVALPEIRFRWGRNRGLSSDQGPSIAGNGGNAPGPFRKEVTLRRQGHPPNIEPMPIGTPRCMNCSIARLKMMSS